MDVETSAKTDAAMPSISADSSEEQEDYRTLSLLSVVGLLFGLASPLALLATLLLAVPLFGIAITVLSLFRISRSQGVMTGRRVALFGLALCVVSLVALPSQSIARKRLLSTQAQAQALEWFTLIQKNQHDLAFQRTATNSPPKLPGGAEATPKDPKQQYFENSLISALQTIGDRAEVQFEKDVAIEAGSRGKYYLQQQYLILYQTDEKGQQSLLAELVWTRSPGRAGSGPRWVIENYKLVE